MKFTRLFWAVCVAAMLLVGAATASAQVHPTGISTINLTQASSGTPMAVAYHPGQNKYYASDGGTPSYYGYTYNYAGALLASTAPIGVDLRSLIYNPTTSNIEGCSYYPELYTMGLDGSGLLTGTNTFISSYYKPNNQLMPAYNPTTGELLMRNSSTLYRVSRATGSLTGSFTLNLGAAGNPNLQSYPCGYDVANNYLVFFDRSNRRAIIFDMSGNYVGYSSLPNVSSPNSSYGMGYANGQIFVYDSSSDSWEGYEVLQQNATPTVGTNNGLTLDEGATATIGTAELEVTDADNSADELTLTLETIPTHGTLFLSGTALIVGDDFTQEDIDNNLLTYTHDGSENFSDSFDFDAEDPNGAATGSTTFDITITPVNDPPMLGTPTPLSGLEDAPLDFQASDFTAFFTDGEGDPLMKIQVITLPANGSLTVNGAPVAAMQEVLAADLDLLDFTPDPDFFGTVTLDWNAHDGTEYAVAPVSTDLVIEPVNDPPTLTGGAAQNILEDAGMQTVPGWATGIVVGPPNEVGQVVTTTIINNTNPALFAIAPAVDPLTGTLTYTPADDAFGAATVTLALQDDGGTANGGNDTSASVTLDVTIGPVNDPPTAAPDDYTVDEDSATTTFDIMANDSGAPDVGETVTITGVDTPDNGGTAVLVGSQVEYTPAADFFGTETFTYTLNDGTPGSDATGTVTVTVNPVDDAPFIEIPMGSLFGYDAVNNVYKVGLKKGSALVNEVTLNVVDIDGDTLTLTNISVDLSPASIDAPTVGQTAPDTLALAWTGIAAVSDAGSTFTYTLTIDDGAGTPVVFTILVTIKKDDDSGCCGMTIDGQTTQSWWFLALILLPLYLRRRQA